MQYNLWDYRLPLRYLYVYIYLLFDITCSLFKVFNTSRKEIIVLGPIAYLNCIESHIKKKKGKAVYSVMNTSYKEIMNLKVLIKKIYTKISCFVFPTHISQRGDLYINRGKSLIQIGNRIINRGGHNQFVLGDNVDIRNCTVKFFGNNNKLIIKTGCKINDVVFHFEDDNNTIQIGEQTRFVGDTHIACVEGKMISIGNDCLFSNDLVLRTSDSHSIIDKNNKRINPPKDILIGNHVWVGNKVVILKGTTISDNSIIGSGSLVAGKGFESNVIVAGNPGKIVKEGVDWVFERIELPG